MLELLINSRKSRSRYYTQEQIDKGLFIIEKPDFPAEEKSWIVEEIVEAYEAGRLEGEILDLARRLGVALRTAQPTLAALRVCLQADGRDMVAKIRQVGAVVPAVQGLANWIAC